MKLDKILDHLKLDDDEKELFLTSLSKPNRKCIRLNTRKNVNHLREEFKDLAFHPFVPDCYLFDNSKIATYSKSLAYASGLYYIQDPSSLMPIYLAGIKENDIVLDMCAAPGGKSTYIASLLKTGFLVANEIDKKRIGALKENLYLFSNPNIAITNFTPSYFKTLDLKFDKVVIDAPCSNLGSIRKSTFEININTIKQFAKIQKELVDIGYFLLKKDGVLIYSTCTYSVEENEEIVQYLLDKYDCSLLELEELPGIKSGINLKNTYRFTHYDKLGEGQFVALIKKNEVDETRNIVLEKSSGSHNKYVDCFIENYVTDFSFNYFVSSTNTIYFLPNYLIKSLLNHTGIEIGEIKNNTFIPNNYFALLLDKDKVKYSLDVTDSNKDLILSGRELETDYSKIYLLLTYLNIPFALEYTSNNRIRNRLNRRFMK